MEWQVGQWVECVSSDGSVLVNEGRFYRVDESWTDGGLSLLECRGHIWDQKRFKPFVWQVGKTYRTTRDGTTAIVRGTSVTGNVVGMLSNGVALSWDNKTGLVIGYEQHDGAQHLLPFLADEPSKPEPTLTEPQQLDPINPQHYRTHPSGIECIQVAEHMSYCLGNAIKYLWRAGKKGDAIEDLKKAAWYLQREIERLEKLRKGGVA